MATLLETMENPGELSPLPLAFIGDGVFELLARRYIVGQGNCPVKKLHTKTVELVRCETQARLLHKAIFPALTPEEQDVCLRGRNAHVGHVPKNASVADYHGATALEALFGWLALRGEVGRVNELFSIFLKAFEEETNE